jgi:hypothetical protein
LIAFAAKENVATPPSIADIAQARLRASPYPSIRRILCFYHEGILVLRGRLPTFFHTQVAQTAVADIEGVVQVVNQVKVFEPAS